MHLLVRRFSSIEGKGYEYNNPDESREIKLNGPNDESTSSKTMKGKTSDENKRGGRKSGNQTTRPIAQHVSSLYKRSGESIRLQLRQCCNDYTYRLVKIKHIFSFYNYKFVHVISTATTLTSSIIKKMRFRSI